LVEQAGILASGSGGECGEEFAQVAHLLEIDLFKFGELFLRLTVVT
jgi:hypothetical protein